MTIDTSVPVTLNGLRFNGPAVDGVEWSCETVEGLGGPGVRYESGPRVQADGQWSTQAYRTGQAMGLSGMVEFGSAADIPRLKAVLDDAVAVDPVPLTVHWPSGDQTRTVRRDGGVEIGAHTDRFFTWSCTVVADDPHWYMGGPGESPVPGVLPPFPASDWRAAQTALPSASGGMSFPFSFPFAFDAVVVTGDFTITTPRGGWWYMFIQSNQDELQKPRIVVTAEDGVARTLAWELSLRAGEFLLIDPAKKTSMLQGQAPRVPSVREWPTLGPGTTLVQFRAENYVNAIMAAYWVPFA